MEFPEKIRESLIRESSVNYLQWSVTSQERQDKRAVAASETGCGLVSSFSSIETPDDFNPVYNIELVTPVTCSR